MHLFFRKLYKQVTTLSWPIIIFLIVLPHYYTTYKTLEYYGEPIAVKENLVTFTYFWMTTITTIGYGDFSMQTNGGRFFASIFILPGGVAIFGILLTKILESFKIYWRKKLEGQMDYSNLSNHIVILGWHGDKTIRMIDLIFGDTRREKREVLLCASKDITNPDSERVLFVKGDSLTNETLLKRAGVPTASKIIVLGEDDDQTLAAGLAVSRLINYSVDCNLVAYFEKESAAELLRSHCNKAECVVSLSIDMLVRAAQDPGSSLIQKNLMSTLEGPTQFSIKVSDIRIPYGSLFTNLKEKHNATLIAILEGKELLVNPPWSHEVTHGDVLYYIANERLKIDWNKF